MFVLMQYKTVAALTNVRADRVDALVLAAAVVLAALIFVCERHTCNTSLVWKQRGRGAVKEQVTPTGKKTNCKHVHKNMLQPCNRVYLQDCNIFMAS